jgi:hypothetical protein
MGQAKHKDPAECSFMSDSYLNNGVQDNSAEEHFNVDVQGIYMLWYGADI